MRRACIDIGSNTTRLPVADRSRRWLSVVHQERAFTHVRCVATPVGSAEPVRRCLRSDPPSPSELDGARSAVEEARDGLEVSCPNEAIAVGGSAASLARLAGEVLDARALARALRLPAAEPARAVARRSRQDVERVRLLPGGLLILEGAARRFGLPLRVGTGGLREGVLLGAAVA